MKTIENSNLNIASAASHKLAKNEGATMHAIDNPPTDYVDLTDQTEDQAIESDVKAALPTLDEALAGVSVRDSFVFTAKLAGGATRDIPVRFQHWDPRNVGKPTDFSGLLVGEPASWSQPLKDYYDAQSGFSAVNMIEKWIEIDPQGLLMNLDWDSFYQTPRGENFGYTELNYCGEHASSIPGFSPRSSGRSSESYTTAWGELVKTNRMPEIGFIAARNGKYYPSTNDWQKAQRVYRECSFTIAMVNEENGFSIWTGPVLQNYAKYFWSLWNLTSVNPDLAAQIAKQHYSSSILRKKMRKASQKQWVKNEQAEKAGTPVEKVTVACGIPLIEGVLYEIKSPTGTTMNEVRFSLSDKNAQTKFATAQAYYARNDKWKIIPTNR